MDSKPLLYGLIGFFIGGFIVAVAATTFDKPSNDTGNDTGNRDSMSMSQMTASLQDKTGDEYDELFLSYMIDHHESAVNMAKLSESRSNRAEIKNLSNDIITAQEKETRQMKQWQHEWGYSDSAVDGMTPH